MSSRAPARRPMQVGARVALAVVLVVGALAAGGCRSVETETDADERVVEALVGRWEGAPTGAPEDGWWKGTTWTLLFSPSGEYVATAQTVVEAIPSVLHFEGEYAVRYGKLYLYGPSLRGEWTCAVEERRELPPGVARDAAEWIEKQEGAPAEVEPEDVEPAPEDPEPGKPRSQRRDVLRLERVADVDQPPDPEAARIRLRLVRRFGLYQAD